MQQSSSGVLVSIILIVGLAVAFAAGIHYVGAGVASSTLAAPTATAVATEVVGPANSTGTGQPRAGTGRRGSSAQSTPLPATPTPPPPSPTPVPQADVVMSFSLGPHETAAQKTTTFPTTASQVWCVATFHTVGPGDSVAFRYVSADTNATIWQSGANDIVPPITGVEHDTTRATFLQGPFSAGKYRCDLLINGKVVANAPFTVQ